MFCIFLNFIDKILVRNRYVLRDIIASVLVIHQNLLTHQPQILHLALQFSIFCYVGLVNQIELCLNRYLYIFNDMIDFCTEHSKIIFNSSFFFLYFLLQHINIFLFISQQKDQFLGKDIRFVDQIAEMGGLAI